MKRLSHLPVPTIFRVVSPADCTEIFNELCDDPEFPVGTIFDWRLV